jgi:transcriptional antiterminator NusG
MMAAKVTLDERIAQQDAVLRELARRDAEQAMRAAWRRAAVLADGDPGAWYAIRIVSGVGVKRWHAPDGTPQERHDNRESLIADSLRMAGIDIYCPRDAWRQRMPRSKRVKKIEAPLFPGYAFVRLPKTWDALRGVLSFDGVIGVVGSSTGPRVIGQREMDNIKGIEKLAPKDRRNAAALALVGKTVTVGAGAFKGSDAKVVAVDPKRRTATLEIALFGGVVPMVIGLDECRDRT